MPYRRNQAEPNSKLGLMFNMLADEMSLFDRGICHSVQLAGKCLLTG